MMCDFEPVTPILRSFDEKVARRFYVDYLGFSWDGEHRFDDAAPLYAFLSRGAAKLHLSEHYGDAAPGASVIIPVSNIDAYLAEIRSRGHPNANPNIHEVPWAREITVADPFGNRLSFQQLRAS